MMTENNFQLGYYSVLGLTREPFSSSPDPSFFFPTTQHDNVLTNLLIEARLRRGLSVIFGDVGTGKTTLSRKFLHELHRRNDFLFHLVLDPAFSSETHFLQSLVRNLEISIPGHLADDSACLRDAIERFLIEQTVKHGKTVVLVIDEAQKLDLEILESLRVLLNFETNEQKLIQIVLFGQLELYSKVVHMKNFIDRISYKFTLLPLDLEETYDLINHRIKVSGFRKDEILFPKGIVENVFEYTKGYPRKINWMCHQLLKKIVEQDEKNVTKRMIEDLLNSEKSFFSTRNEQNSFFTKV